MKLPISKRLLGCADKIQPGSRVADIGCDHGYLGIYLLRQNLASHVIACDLRPKPLQRAKQNAMKYGVQEGLEFRLGSGLTPVAPGEVDTVVFAGMGGELISILLDQCPWVCDGNIRYILQPQASGNDLRRWLGEHNFSILEEELVQDGRFLYTVMQVCYGGGKILTPGEQYVSPAMQRKHNPLFSQYLNRVQKGLVKAVEGLTQSDDKMRLHYYEQALQEVEEMKRNYDHC